MTEASDAPSAALATVVYVARALWSVPWRRYLVRVGRLVALPLSLVTVPLSYVAEALLVIFAPLIHLAAFAFASAQSALALLASLKIAAAAGIGIVAGIVLGATSSVITSYLGMQDSDEDFYERERDYLDYYDDEEDEEDEERYRYGRDPYGLDAASYQKHLRGSDSDTGPKRRVARGLLSQTIHEEDDSSGG
ncbi:hypothetical protein LEL_04199 [Akanthomyces lecanii RCEF 1005]|uniref:Uncharacterized protein n=1 Tax=Akanthomyces lecanii RCEF 1005 TaxID=1081108 RepID=A0A168H6Q5_CORDF|nr:hypothetical protein LEL_04199 [Akanthomyces lecanii RCEF 1005]